MNSYTKTEASTDKKTIQSYHLYSFELGSNGVIFSIDTNVTLKTTIGHKGFWDLGEFAKNYTWNCQSNIGRKMVLWEARRKGLPLWKGDSTVIKIDRVQVWKLSNL